PGGPRLAGRALDAEVAALEAHRLLVPQPLQDLHALLERAHALAERREDAARGAELGLEPAGAEAGDDAPGRDLVDRRDLLGEHRRVAEEGRRHERPEPRAPRRARDRGEQ